MVSISEVSNNNVKDPSDIFAIHGIAVELSQWLLPSSMIAFSQVNQTIHQCYTTTELMNWERVIRHRDGFQYPDSIIEKFNGVEHGRIQYCEEQVGIIYDEEYKDGKRHGKSLKYTTDGKMLKETDYVDGKKHGKHYKWSITNYYLRKEVDYVDGKRHGNVTMWDCVGYVIMNGKLLLLLHSTEEYADGQPNGLYRSYHDTESNNLRKEEYYYYEKDTLNKRRRCFYKNGQMESEQMCQSYFKWHENGNLKMQCYFLSGNMHGNVTGWQCYFLSGIMHGDVTEWDEYGNVVKIQTYDNGKPHGPLFTWNSEGTLLSAINYENGVNKGYEFKFNQDGSVQSCFSDNNGTVYILQL